MKFAKRAALVFALFFITAAPALAQETPVERSRVAYASAPKYPFHDTRALAAGVVILGAAFGIGGLAKSAVESMARQPEVAAQINTSMITAAALIEGATFFALIVIIVQQASY